MVSEGGQYAFIGKDEEGNKAMRRGGPAKGFHSRRREEQELKMAGLKRTPWMMDPRNANMREPEPYPSYSRRSRTRPSDTHDD